MNTPAPLDAIPLPPLPEPDYLGYDSDDGAIYGYDTAHMNNHARLAVTEALAAQAAAQPTVVASGAERIALLEAALSEVLEFQSAAEGPHIFDWGRWRRIRDNTAPFQRADLSTASTELAHPASGMSTAPQAAGVVTIRVLDGTPRKVAWLYICGLDLPVGTLLYAAPNTAAPEEAGRQEVRE